MTCFFNHREGTANFMILSFLRINLYKTKQVISRYSMPMFHPGWIKQRGISAQFAFGSFYINII